MKSIIALSRANMGHNRISSQEIGIESMHGIIVPPLLSMTFQYEWLPTPTQSNMFVYFGHPLQNIKIQVIHPGPLFTKKTPSYQYSVSPIYRGHVYRGIGYIAVACWTPFFWRPRARYFSRNRGNSLDPIRRRQFFAKSAHRDSLCSRFAGDNFSRNQLWGSFH